MNNGTTADSSENIGSWFRIPCCGRVPVCLEGHNAVADLPRVLNDSFRGCFGL